MTYALDESRTATSWTSGAQAGRGAPTEIVIHHWGVDGQSHDGVVSFFCAPGTQTSPHYVASAGRVSCLVAIRDVAWHAGVWAVNVRSIGIECRPEATDADYATIAELIRDLRKVYGDLPLRPHRLYVQTDCPGRYDLSRLDALARAGTAGQSTTGTTVKETNMALTNTDLQAIARTVWGYRNIAGGDPHDMHYYVLHAAQLAALSVWGYRNPNGDPVDMHQMLKDAAAPAAPVTAALTDAQVTALAAQLQTILPPAVIAAIAAQWKK